MMGSTDVNVMAASGDSAVRNSGTIARAAAIIRGTTGEEADDYIVTQGFEDLPSVACRLSVRPELHRLLAGILTEMGIACGARMAIKARQNVVVDPECEAHKQQLALLYSKLTGKELPVDAWCASGVDSSTGDTPEPPLGITGAMDDVSSAGLSAAPVGLSTQRGGACWRELGFHGYPFRDFRGMGKLGLDCLWYFAEKYPNRAREVMREIHSVGGASVPFALAGTIVGLNVAQWLQTMLDEGLLDIFFYHNSRLSVVRRAENERPSPDALKRRDSGGNRTRRPHQQQVHIGGDEGGVGPGERGGAEKSGSPSTSGVQMPPVGDEEFEEGAVEVMCLLFSYAMLEFCRFWHEMRPVDILQFGVVSGKFRENFRATLKGLTDEAAHSEWSFQANTGDELIDEMHSWIEGSVHQHVMEGSGIASGRKSRGRIGAVIGAV